jgi:cryptochrome
MRRVGVNRYNFMLECLSDLDASFKARGSRLLVMRGKPEDVFPRVFKVRISFPTLPLSPPLPPSFLPPTWPPPTTNSHLSLFPPLCTQDWGITQLCYEADTEPYAEMRDSKVQEMAAQAGVEVKAMVSHTLYVSSLSLSASAQFAW